MNKAHTPICRHTQRRRILELLREHGTLTINEVARLMEIPDHWVSGRFAEMVRKQWIELTGAKRPNRITNFPCQLYREAQEAKGKDVRELTAPPLRRPRIARNGTPDASASDAVTKPA